MEEKFYDRSRAAGAHARQDGADDVGQAEDVDVEDPADLFVGALLHGGEVADAGVVDDHVDAAEVVLGSRDGFLDLRGVGDVEGQGERLVVSGDEVLDLIDVPGGDDGLVAGGEDLYLDWAQVTSEVVGVLRAEAGRNPHDPQIAEFVAELRSVSPEFRTWWAERTVVERTWGTKRFNHPVVGRLDITYEALSLPGDPDQILFVYAGKTDDLEKLRILASWYAQSTPTPPMPARTRPRLSRTRRATETPATPSPRQGVPPGRPGSPHTAQNKE